MFGLVFDQFYGESDEVEAVFTDFSEAQSVAQNISQVFSTTVEVRRCPEGFILAEFFHGVQTI